jgi:hypothetical protein
MSGRSSRSPDLLAFRSLPVGRERVRGLDGVQHPVCSRADPVIAGMSSSRYYTSMVAWGRCRQVVRGARIAR